MFGPFSHKRNDHIATPPRIIDDLNKHFNFDFDPCPLMSDFDGLSDEMEWGDSNFINPPYSGIKKWILKAIKDTKKRCVFLIPARISSKYWRENVWEKADVIYFFTEGVTFVGYDTTYPTPMSVVVFNHGKRPPKLTSIGGYTVVTIRNKKF